jgi:hypothetical protein
VNDPPGRELKIRSINSSPPTPLNINEKIEAPIRIVKIIVETTAVFSEVSFKKFKLTFLLINAINKAPNAPMAAASVGVAIPANIEPRTKKIKTIGSARVLSSSTLSIANSVEVSFIFKLLLFLYSV